MDNVFYNVNDRKSQKERRKKESQYDALYKVLIIHIIFTILITGLVFGICKTDTKLSKDIKSYYSYICKNDVATSKIYSDIKEKAKSVFAPLNHKNNLEKSKEELQKVKGENVTFSPLFLTFRLEKPVENGKLTSYFGFRNNPINNKNSFHYGIDISAPKDTIIKNVYDGTVIETGKNNYRGNYLVIKHSDTVKTTYSHCSKILVTKGMNLRKGETIALVGSTGNSTGNHLHFEILLNNKFMNPLWVIDYGI